MLYKLPLQSWS